MPFPPRRFTRASRRSWRHVAASSTAPSAAMSHIGAAIPSSGVTSDSTMITGMIP